MSRGALIFGLSGLGLATSLACGGWGGSHGPVGTRCAADGLQRVDFWQGEYPEPVLHVTMALDVPAYADPCDASSTTHCLIAPGVYHPWGAGAGFATLRQVDRYTATAAFEVEGIAVAAGQTVEIPTYLAEGYCRWRVAGQEIEAMCPGVEPYPLEAVEAPALGEVQLLDPGCGAWVEVGALYAASGVKDGTVLGYGEVGPAQ